jgi:signal transduction histidine kinase
MPLSPFVSATEGLAAERRPWLARALLGLMVLLLLAGVTFGALDIGLGTRPSSVLSGGGFLLVFIAFPFVGYLIATRRPENSIGWVMLGSGIALGLDGLLNSYGSYAIHGGIGGTGFGSAALAIDGPMWLPIIAVPATLLIMLFPDGHLPSPRWRWFAWLLGASLAIVFVGIVLTPGAMTDVGHPDLTNPIGIEALRPIFNVSLAFLLVLPVGVVASVVSLVRRYRRAAGTERLQLRWLVTAAAIVGVLYAVALLASLPSSWMESNTPPALAVLQAAALLSFALIPVAIGVSVLRYRLFEIDVVINRALLFGVLAVFITIVYVAVVVGVGAFVGGRANALLSAAAAAVVALAFQPIRHRAQRLADRLVYGKRATPYEVLSEFSGRLGTAYASDELLPKMVRALAEGTGAARVDIWVRVGDELRAQASWPDDAEAPAPMSLAEAQERSATGASIVEPVRHHGEFLGALSITKRPGDAVTATEERLVHDLAAQAGLVLRNVQLTGELLDHIEQLRSSRQRLVAAQDEERRKLERNLHDGAQQQLVALGMKLRLLRQMLDRDLDKARPLADELETQATSALDDLRNLARGIYPPLLADQGLLAALSSQARRSVVPVAVEGDHVGRYPREVESAIYFACLEALQNVAKYANASQATITLSDRGGQVGFEVMDDGVGFDPGVTSYGTGLQGIADRVAAAGGEVQIESHPGGGTSVRGSIPISSG